ncbi:FAD binding domain-containing protein [Mycena filopes]|nr:FAD binding domain-containing protein [Mycena filopes]
MVSVHVLLAALAFLRYSAFALRPPYAYFSADATQRHADFAAQLGPRLSHGAAIYLEGSDEFEKETIRWQLFAPPHFRVAVVVAEEEDVQLTVALANAFGLPWLAVSGHHGAIGSLAKMKNGVQISLTQLNEISVDPDGQTANIGGGALSKNVTDALWAVGKQTVTGTCECVSLVGPMLGGGHGLLQGRYGLMIDQLVEARVVLADGSLITTSEAESEHPDLFWALRGAGHNFGIVTRVRYRVYDVPEGDQWVVASLVFLEDKLEEVFELTNELSEGGMQPVEFLNFVVLLRAPAIDANKAVLNVYILYEGSLADAAAYTDRYTALGPVASTIQQTTYPHLASLLASGTADFSCLKGAYRSLRFPVSVRDAYDVGAVRRLYTTFDAVASAAPALNATLFFFEGYGVRGVRAVPPESTAFPDRFNAFLTSSVFSYFDKGWDGEALSAGREMREIMRDGDGDGGELSVAYVNYAHGDEGVEGWYGHEKWRVDRLRALKRKYDPENRFKFYAPIVDDGSSVIVE